MPLAEFAVALRDRWWAVLISALVAGAIGFAYAHSQTSVYRSSVRLEISGNADYSQVLAVEKILGQVGAHVRTTTVADEIDRRLGLGIGADAVREKLRTQVFADSLVLQIDAEDADPATAVRLAGAAGDVAQEAQARTVESAPPDQRITVVVLDKPSAAQFVWPQTRAILSASVVAGGLAGILLVLVLDYLEDAIETEGAVRRWLALPVLGVIPMENK